MGLNERHVRITHIYARKKAKTHAMNLCVRIEGKRTTFYIGKVLSIEFCASTVNTISNKQVIVVMCAVSLCMCALKWSART